MLGMCKRESCSDVPCLSYREGLVRVVKVVRGLRVGACVRIIKSSYACVLLMCFFVLCHLADTYITSHAIATMSQGVLLYGVSFVTVLHAFTYLLMYFAHPHPTILRTKSYIYPTLTQPTFSTPSWSCTSNQHAMEAHK